MRHRKPSQKVSKGAQTALAGWGIGGKDGNESFLLVDAMKQKRGAFRCCRWHNADELNYKQHLKMMKSTQEDCISYSRKGKHINESERQPLIEKLKEQVWLLLNDAPPVFQKLCKTLRLWFVPIIRMWHFTKSNGITEGFHRKMKLIQRRGFGYRNFQNYRLRVLIECGRILV